MLGLLLLLLLGATAHVQAQHTTDSIAIVQADTLQQKDSTAIAESKSRKKRKDRNLRFSILGGPGYSPDFGALLGGSFLFTFKTNPKDSLLSRSVVPSSFALTQSGISMVIRPQLFFKSDKMRLFGQFIYKRTNDNYYGVGFDTNKHRERGTEGTQFLSNTVIFQPNLMFRVAEKLYVGAAVDIGYEEMQDVAKGIQEDEWYLRQGGTSKGLTNWITGVGVNLSYDTRDVPANAYKGLYLDFKAMSYLKALGGDYNYQTVDVDYRQYLPLKFLGKRRTLAWTVQTHNAFGDVPFTRMPLTGTPFDLRGYYQGQFRDKSSHIAVIEYRHMINIEDPDTRIKRLVNKLGFVAWGGVGAMGPTPFDIQGILPNFGAGIRIEVQPRMNFRMDIGRDPINKQNLLYFNMTEAF